MDIERQEFPKLYQARLMIEEPKLSDLARILAALLDNGVPETAALRITRWNQPDTTYYFITNWTDESGS